MTDARIPPFHSSDAPPDWEALARYQAGESPEPEARAVAAWLAAHPRDAALLESLDAALASATSADGADGADGAYGTEGDDVDVEAALRRVQARRVADARVGAAGAAGAAVLPMRRRLVPRERGATLPPTHTLVRRFVGTLAAAAAIGALAVGLARSRGGDDASSSAVRVVAAGGEVTTPVGVRDSLRLPDGTAVVLAPGSRLAVDRGYRTGGERVVALDGAALFTVRHDSAHQFVVRAGHGMVSDVGTTFAVRTDGIDGPGGGVSVSVAEGAVRLWHVGAGGTVPDTVVADSGVVLAAGDRGELHADGRVVAARGAASDADVSWARGRLAYDAAPLAVVRADLQRWYGIDLRVADSALARRRLTATFDGDSASRVLDVVALALGATVERNGTVAVLRPASAPAAATTRRGDTR